MASITAADEATETSSAKSISDVATDVPKVSVRGAASALFASNFGIGLGRKRSAASRAKRRRTERRDSDPFAAVSSDSGGEQGGDGDGSRQGSAPVGLQRRESHAAALPVVDGTLRSFVKGPAHRSARSLPMSTPSGVVKYTNRGRRRIRGGAGGPFGTASVLPTADAAAAAAPSSSQRSADGARHKQLFLDFGQKSFSSVTCASCGMVYSPGVLEDDEAHVKYCERRSAAIAFPGWKGERVVKRYDDGTRVIEVWPHDRTAHVAKVDEVKVLMDADMGFFDGDTGSSRRRTLLHIGRRQVMGAVVVEDVRCAFRLLGDGEKDGHPCENDGEKSAASQAAVSRAVGDDAALAATAFMTPTPAPQPLAAVSAVSATASPCVEAPTVASSPDEARVKAEQRLATEPAAPVESVTTPRAPAAAVQRAPQDKVSRETPGGSPAMWAGRKPVPCVLGVSQVWTHPRFRRQRVAWRLLDVARERAQFNFVVPRAEVAFSQPTQAGRALAKRFTATDNFLVYS